MSNRGKKLGWPDAMILVIGIIALGRAFSGAEVHSEEFHASWTAARVWASGALPHGTPLLTPWTLPLYGPFALLEWEWARRLWFAVGVGCLLFALNWCIKHGAPRRIAAFAAGLCGWGFFNHLVAGQSTWILLTFGLWAWPAGIRPGDPAALSRGNGFREGTLAFLLSTQATLLWTLAGIPHRFRRWSPWLWCSAFVLLSHGILAGVAWRAHETPPLQTFKDLYREGGIFSSLGPSLGLGFAFKVTLSLFWARLSRKLSEAERWAGWIAIGGLPFPLCALALARAWKTRRWPWIWLALLCAGGSAL